MAGQSVPSNLDLLGLGIAVIALLVAIFPVREYLVERYWPFKLAFRDTPRSSLRANQYRVEIVLRNRTNRTTYFGLAFEGMQPPSENAPVPTIIRMSNGEPVNRGSFSVGPNETDGWVLFLNFDRPLSIPVTMVLFNRSPELRGTLFPGRPQHTFRHDLQPVVTEDSF
jgi:hypothetical protein